MEDQNIIMSEEDFYEHICTTTTGESKVYTHTHIFQVLMKYL